jgi:glycosyltransferase involved in cell wall biosynthesis
LRQSGRGRCDDNFTGSPLPAPTTAGGNPIIHVIILNYFYETRFKSAEALLDQYFSLTGWAEGLVQAGAQVTVLQRFQQDLVLERQGIAYHFVSDKSGPRLRGWQIPRPIHRLAAELSRASIQANNPTCVHLNGLLFPLQARLLHAGLPREAALVVQHHAESPWPPPQQLIQRWCLRPMDGFLFTNRALAQEWLEAGIIRAGQDVYEVMETSSSLPHQAKAAARRITGMTGKPILLWTGNLNHNKDPLTILAGFELILEQAPEAHLYMAFRQADLLPQVQARIAQSPALAHSVTLLGRIPYGEIAPYYNSADLFVQGSSREGSGIALLDALACGVIPVVTDIPSFQTITGNGQVGALWSVGRPESFAAAVLELISRPLDSLSQEARHFFDLNWTFPAITRRAMAIYLEILQKQGHPVNL